METKPWVPHSHSSNIHFPLWENTLRKVNRLLFFVVVVVVIVAAVVFVFGTILDQALLLDLALYRTNLTKGEETDRLC